MKKPILTVLAPVLAIMAFAVLPAMAQADEIQAFGPSETFSATSGNLATSIGANTIECTTSTLVLQRQSATQAIVAGGSFQGPTGSEQYCPLPASDWYFDVQTNAGSVFWQLHLEGQDPEHEGHGMATLQGILGNIAFTWHFYHLNQATSEYEAAGQCTFSTPSVQIQYEYGANPGLEANATVTATNEGAPEGFCEEGTLGGSFSTSGLTIDHA